MRGFAFDGKAEEILPVASCLQSRRGDAVRMSAESPLLFPDLAFEDAAFASGARRICGVDEAGRGPLAGPVVVSAVVLDRARVPDGLNDSKALTAARRETLYEQIIAAASVSIVVAPPRVIAELNILGATMWAMRQAVLGLAERPDHILIDGNRLPKGLPCPAEAIVSGDARSASIAEMSSPSWPSRRTRRSAVCLDAPHITPSTTVPV